MPKAEKKRMLAGELYLAADLDPISARDKSEPLDPGPNRGLAGVLQERLDSQGKNSTIRRYSASHSLNPARRMEGASHGRQSVRKCKLEHDAT